MEMETGIVKLMFIFTLAYILEIKRELNTRLPNIIDLPSGKEVDCNNVEAMINILKRDFSENQIIMAPIYNYYFDNINVIII